MKKIIQLFLLVVIAGLTWWLYQIITTPLKFEAIKVSREVAVVERLKDIRDAQRAFKLVNGHYTKSFDSLIHFVKTDSIEFETKFGSEDDSLAVAQGKVKTIKFKLAVKDTIFSKDFNIDEISIIPFSDNVKFIMDAADLKTESDIVIPVFEAKAPFKAYLGDLDNQILINSIDAAKTIGRYPGMTVGSINSATNDAGNWE